MNAIKKYHIYTMLVLAISSMHALHECEGSTSEIYLLKNLPSKRISKQFQILGDRGTSANSNLMSDKKNS